MSIDMKNSIVIDVRSAEEFESGHFPGAVNIPLDQIMQYVEDLKKSGKSIITYCRSGNRSGIAASILCQQGVKTVTNGGSLHQMMQHLN